MRYKQVTT